MTTEKQKVDSQPKNHSCLIPVVNVRTGKKEFINPRDPKIAKALLESMQKQPAEYD